MQLSIVILHREYANGWIASGQSLKGFFFKYCKQTNFIRYPDDVLQGLFGRYERPDTKNRWVSEFEAMLSLM